MTASTTEIVPRAEEPSGQDAEFLMELAAGDVTALARWFHRHQPGLYAFAYFHAGRNADLAADATQATFANALARLADFDPRRGDMGTWLRTLARNVIRGLLTQHRRSIPFTVARRTFDDSSLDAFEKIDCQPLPQALLERQETRELVAMTLASLPPRYQEVLEARYLLGQPLETIAQRRSTTLDGVKSMLRRARDAFRQSFLALAETDVSDE